MMASDTGAARRAAFRAEAALDAIHAALVIGQLSGLDPLAAEIEAALVGIEGLDDVGLAVILQRKAQRNEACLGAAARGVRAAARRMRDLAALAQGLQTYDEQGRRAALGPGAGLLARRL